MHHKFLCKEKLLISRVEKIHYRFTYDTTHDEVLSMDSDVSIHQRHLPLLVTEVFKSMNNLNLHFKRNYFKTIFFPYDLRKVNTLHLALRHSTRHGIDLLLFGGSLLWNNLPWEVKKSLSTEELNKRLKEHGTLPRSCEVFR